MGRVRVTIPRRLSSRGAGDQAHVGVKGLRDALQRPGRGAGRSAFDAADVRLVDAAALGELLLGEAVALAQVDDLQGDVVGRLEDLRLLRSVRAEPGAAAGHDVVVVVRRHNTCPSLSGRVATCCLSLSATRGLRLPTTRCFRLSR
jgi:hypothetical protein